MREIFVRPLAVKIITELKKAHTIGEHRLHVTVSIGLSTYPDNSEDAETLIKNADRAMYDATPSNLGATTTSSLDRT